MQQMNTATQTLSSTAMLSKLLTPIESDYDYIIIDCPPQGYKLLENVQRYADYILIPMIPDEFALHSLRIKAESLIEIRRTINPHLRLLGGLIIMDEKNGTKAIYRDALQSQDVIPFFSATVRKNITLSRAINAHERRNVLSLTRWRYKELCWRKNMIRSGKLG